MHFQNPCILWAYEYAIAWGHRRGLDGDEYFNALYAKNTDSFRTRLHTWHMGADGRPIDPTSAHPGGFLRISLRNYHLDLIRQQKSRAHTIQKQKILGNVPAPIGAPTPLSTPSRIIEKSRLLKEILHEEFARTPIQGWCFFYQRYLGETNPEEVSRQLNISPQSVSSYATQFARALLNRLQQVGIDTIPDNVNETTIFLSQQEENP